MGEMVYALCALTSVACSVLLMRGYSSSGVRLLLWSALCFGGLALNNALLFLDLVVIPETDLSLLRAVVQLGAMIVLLYGLVWETQ